MLKKIIKFTAAFLIVAALVFAPIPKACAANLNTSAVSVSISYANVLQGKTIILDPGHGKGNTNIYANYDEQATMLKLALKIKPLLESYGAAVYMTRPDQKDVSVYVRTALINKLVLQTLKDSRQKKLDNGTVKTETEKSKLKNDITEIDRLLGIIQNIIDNPDKNAPIYLNAPFDYTYKRAIHPDMKEIFEFENDPEVRDKFLLISLHSDATGEPIDASANGATAIYITNTYYESINYYNNYSNVQLSKNFAESIVDNISKIGIKKFMIRDDCYAIIREHNIPAVLIENGFHTNAGDREKLSDDKFLDKLAGVYADTVAGYFSANISSPEIKLLDAPKSIYISKSFAVYKEPSFSADKIADYLPQTVIISAVTDTGWGLISTSGGKYWAYIEDI